LTDFRQSKRGNVFPSANDFFPLCREKVPPARKLLCSKNLHPISPFVIPFFAPSRLCVRISLDNQATSVGPQGLVFPKYTTIQPFLAGKGDRSKGRIMQLVSAVVNFQNQASLPFPSGEDRSLNCITWLVSAVSNFQNQASLPFPSGEDRGLDCIARLVHAV
jgi:hypothetical protein